jgi:hypothetical protein
MRFTLVLLILILACIVPMTGCLTLAVYPLYTAADLVADLPIEGTWTDAEAKEVWEIRKNGDAYSIVCTTDSKSEPVEARLLRLGEQRFLDLTAKDTPSLAVAGHFFARVRMSKEELEVQLMDSGWLEGKARETGLASLDLPDKELLLTAPTAELRKFVLRYAGDPGAFEKVTSFHRPR